MNKEDIMFLLEGIAYVSGSLAAFVYVFDTYFHRLNIRKRNRFRSQSSNISLGNIYDDEE